MHRCLCIQEIVRNVAACGANEDLLSMALACRAFYEPAMDFAWRDLTGMGPLMRCLPKKFWVVEDDDDPDFPPFVTIVAESDPPAPEDWDRFRHHARRVRKLVIPSGWLTPPSSRISESCWETLQAFAALHGEPILTNLRKLTWYENKELQFATLFLRPSLRSLEFSNGWTSDRAMIPTLRSLTNVGPSLPKLTHFKMEHQPGVDSDYSPLTLMLLSSVICTLNNLVAVDISATLCDDALCHLASLPALTYLNLAVTRSDYTLSPLARMTDAKFATLTSLHITTGAMDAHPVSSFLDAISPPRLTTIDIFLAEFYAEIVDDEDCQPSAIYLQRLYTALGKISTLTSITIRPWHCGHVEPEFLVEEETLSPLFALKNIRYFGMASSPTKLSASLLGRIAESWPQIRYLALGGQCKHVNRALGIAVEDLLPLAIHCRELQHLSLHITHSRQTDLITFDRLLPSPQSELSVLEVHGPHIAERDDGFIALFLAYAFPKVHIRETLGLSRDATSKALLEKLNMLKDRAASLLEGRSRSTVAAESEER